jgi:hypothetical protein
VRSRFKGEPPASNRTLWQHHCILGPGGTVKWPNVA